jgi:hypothetical protein
VAVGLPRIEISVGVEDGVEHAAEENTEVAVLVLVDVVMVVVVIVIVTVPVDDDGTVVVLDDNILGWAS